MRIKNLPPDYGSIEDRRSSTFGKKTPQPTPGRGPDYTRRVVRPADPRKIETIANEADKTSLPSGPNKGVSNSPPNRYSPGGMDAQVGRMKKEFRDAIRDARSAELRNYNLDRSYDAGAEARGRSAAFREEMSKKLTARDVPLGAEKISGKGGAADSGQYAANQEANRQRIETAKRTSKYPSASRIMRSLGMDNSRPQPASKPSYGGGGRDSGVASRSTSSRKTSYGGGARDSGGVSKSAPARGTERFAKGSLVKSKVNQAGTYTKPGMRKKLFESVKASAVQGTKAGQWSARKAQLLAKKYKASGGGYK
jgi:hypothetical protein